MSLSPRSAFTPIMLSAVALTAALVLSGCSTPFDGNLFGSDAPVVGASPSESMEGSKNGANADQGNTAEVAPGQHHVRLTMTGWAWDFTPTTCVNTDGKLRVSGLGEADKSLRATGHGVDENDANDETNHPAFLDIDIREVDGWPAGKAFVYFFAKKAAPTDHFIKAEVGGGDDYSMGQMVEGYELEVVIKTEDDSPIDTGTFLINCG